jgi:3-deoxy-manno-octulosonate cytidylyltransferase (CMP-KDO synthetase)
MAKIRLDSEFADTNIIKVAVNSNNDLLYMSRASIPLGKDQNKLLAKSYRQVCVYILNKKSLSFYGEGKKKSSLESIEDIEMLRLLDHNLKISMLEVETSSIAVDIPSDIQRVQNYLNES